MPATATTVSTGDAYIDGLLSGVRWAVSSLTYSFPSSSSYYGSSYGSGEPSNDFQAFNSVQKAATRSVLQNYSAVVNVKFSEITESRYKHADLRFAESDSPSTAWAYYPSTSATGGDAWFNSSSGAYDNPQKGNYAWLTILHETGHAMGLKHPHENSGIFSAMPADRDSLEYSVMSYHSYVGATQPYYTNETWSYPQSLMMYDIAALQAMYGANYTTNAGNTVYSWNPDTGEMYLNDTGQGAPGGNRIFLTIWDGGGKDTYDFSNYSTDLNVDLQPGSWSTISSAQLADLGDGYVAAGNIANALLYNNNLASLIENVVGGSGNDSIVGNIANNTFTGGPGNDTMDGGAGTNVAVFSGQYSDYSLIQNEDGSWTVTDLRDGSPDGTDQLKNIQYFKFQDVTVSDQLVQNAPPDAVDDSYVTGRNVKLVVGGAGVLANDVDEDGDALTATLVSGPSKGKLTFNDDGTFTYTPNKYYRGTDSFTYEVSDGVDSDVATVTIKVGSSGGTFSRPTSKFFGFKAFATKSAGLDTEPDNAAADGPLSGATTFVPALADGANGRYLHQPSLVDVDSFGSSLHQGSLTQRLTDLLDSFDSGFNGGSLENGVDHPVSDYAASTRDGGWSDMHLLVR